MLREDLRLAFDEARSHFDPRWFVRPDGHDASRTIHGVNHGARVRVHAMWIADREGFAAYQREALHHAAVWHDIGRTHDGADYYHGAKSAGKLVGLGLHNGIDPFVLDLALFAITHHCGSEEHAERAARWTGESEGSYLCVFRALKDADGLDRVRLGDLDPSLLRYECTHHRIDDAYALWSETGC
ncbi:MAG: hypothetical protein U1E26_05420 [Coriobacteriia bacterium]|nr:hypothetical protein [Coriobacteriia bacterium]